MHIRQEKRLKINRNIALYFFIFLILFVSFTYYTLNSGITSKAVYIESAVPGQRVLGSVDFEMYKGECWPAKNSIVSIKFLGFEKLTTLENFINLGGARVGKFVSNYYVLQDPTITGMGTCFGAPGVSVISQLQMIYGFGKQFIGEPYKVSFNLENLNLYIPPGTSGNFPLEIMISYGGKKVAYQMTSIYLGPGQEIPSPEISAITELQAPAPPETTQVAIPPAPMSEPLEFPPNAIPVTACRVIDSAGYYYLTANIVNTLINYCIRITSNDVILDGNGFVIEGGHLGGSIGVLVSGASTNVSLINLELKKWYTGIKTENSNNNFIYNNHFWDNDEYGIFLFNLNGSIIRKNTINNSKEGIRLDSSSNNNFLDENTVTSNKLVGIHVATSNSNNLVNNIVTSNSYGLRFFSSNNNNATRNTLDSNDGGVSFTGASSGNILIENTMNSNNYGIYLSASNNNFFSSNDAGSNSIAEISSVMSQNNIFVNQKIGSTTVNITYYGDINVKSVTNAPNDPSGLKNISKYLNMSLISGGPQSWFFLTIFYNAGNLGNIDENTLSMWRYNNNVWSNTTLGTSVNGVNAAGDYVYANITNFSIFAPLGTTPSLPNIMIQLINPENNKHIETDFPASVDFRWNATDLFTSTNNCSLYIDETLIGSLQCNNTALCEATVINFTEENSYDWYVNCSDSFGNKATSSVFTFRLENNTIPPDELYCGDGVCSSDEDSTTCCKDCNCPTGYNCVSNSCQLGAPGYCGNSVCDANETQINCCKDCSCPVGYSCIDNACQRTDLICGNSICETGETIINCRQDCFSVYCGNGVCNGEVGENSTICCKDCGCQQDYACRNNNCVSSQRIKLFTIIFIAILAVAIVLALVIFFSVKRAKEKARRYHLKALMPEGQETKGIRGFEMQ